MNESMDKQSYAAAQLNPLNHSMSPVKKSISNTAQFGATQPAPLLEEIKMTGVNSQQQQQNIQVPSSAGNTQQLAHNNTSSSIVQLDDNFSKTAVIGIGGSCSGRTANGVYGEKLSMPSSSKNAAPDSIKNSNIESVSNSFSIKGFNNSSLNKADDSQNQDQRSQYYTSHLYIRSKKGEGPPNGTTVPNTLIPKKLIKGNSSSKMSSTSSSGGNTLNARNKQQMKGQGSFVKQGSQNQTAYPSKMPPTNGQQRPFQGKDNTGTSPVKHRGSAINSSQKKLVINAQNNVVKKDVQTMRYGDNSIKTSKNLNGSNLRPQNNMKQQPIRQNKIIKPTNPQNKIELKPSSYGRPGSNSYTKSTEKPPGTKAEVGKVSAVNTSMNASSVKSTATKTTTNAAGSKKTNIKVGDSKKKGDESDSGSDYDIYNGLDKKSEKIILIKVEDPQKKKKREFRCHEDILLREMKFFQIYTKGNDPDKPNENSLENIDISVQCQIDIFKWLMKFVKQQENPPELEIKNVISILISADYLKMPRLVNHCLKFMSKNLKDVVKLSIDMSCISSHLAKKLATLIEVGDLEKLEDKRDRLRSRLYKKKLELFFENQDNLLNRCAQCNGLFTEKQKEWMVCPKAHSFINYHGELSGEHREDTNWDLNEFVMLLREKKLQWREIYWKMWALTKTFNCEECSHNFTAYDFDRCCYHKEKPKFNVCSHKGTYPCCEMRALRFDPNNKRQGCAYKNHTINFAKLSDELKDIQKMFKENMKVILNQKKAPEHTKKSMKAAQEDDEDMQDEEDYSMDDKSKIPKSPQKNRARDKGGFSRGQFLGKDYFDFEDIMKEYLSRRKKDKDKAQPLTTMDEDDLEKDYLTDDEIGVPSYMPKGKAKTIKKSNQWRRDALRDHDGNEMGTLVKTVRKERVDERKTKGKMVKRSSYKQQGRNSTANGGSRSKSVSSNANAVQNRASTNNGVSPTIRKGQGGGQQNSLKYAGGIIQNRQKRVYGGINRQQY